MRINFLPYVLAERNRVRYCTSYKNLLLKRAICVLSDSAFYMDLAYIIDNVKLEIIYNFIYI